MRILKDIAVTVEERAPGEFFWLLMEAVDETGSDALHYKALRSAKSPQRSYSTALTLGALELRRTTGADAVD